VSCKKYLDMFYEDDDMNLINQIRVGIHAFFCSECSNEIQKYESARSIMKEDFFQSPPEIEDALMARITLEVTDGEEQFESNLVPGGISTRRWVIAGIILMVSLVTAFFGLDFKNLASESGMSFMLPMGITIGIIVTTYGALFIGSHLKELSERFGL